MVGFTIDAFRKSGRIGSEIVHKYLSIILSILFFTCSNLCGQVKNSDGSTFNRGDFTTTNAFFWSSIDLSPYAGTDLGSTPYYIEVLDTNGKKATGYLGAVGAGETLGSETVSNGSFETDPEVEWRKGYTHLASISGGQSGNCCEMTGHVGLTATAWQDIATGIVGQLFLLSAYVKSGTDGNVTYQIINDQTLVMVLNGTTSGSWVQNSVYASVSTTSQNIYFVKPNTILTTLFDEISLKHVTEPPVTAIHIVSLPNGIIRNWASIESEFDPNAIASWNIWAESVSTLRGGTLSGGSIR